MSAFKEVESVRLRKGRLLRRIRSDRTEAERFAGGLGACAALIVQCFRRLKAGARGESPRACRADLAGLVSSLVRSTLLKLLARLARGNP